ncbi:T9SS type A sorting domain-containing protein [Draconibacterium halophilum]|uniref:T9SS type A sorting domain-containing protein n=1 Tax=Draconibacterium halophilum TaxID=2706887 RepID=A0A6C0RBK8_9BACT|nr:T9SS type A sorting domain-containing protein [Draconibacterium halophilum]QIA07469.1 T9SS type A sorting domain-containing protein [Draconibacterium halophilum]
MKLRGKILKSGSLFVLLLFILFNGKGAPKLTTFENGWSVPPVAQNDTFIHVARYDLTVTGNVLVNDYDPNGDKIEILFAASPREAFLLMDKDGNFSLQLPSNSIDTISFQYYIKELTENEYKALGNVFIKITENEDLDEVPNFADRDNDNDGLPDNLDGMGLDTDNDGVPNNFDIDSDNDGITDNIEWQNEHNYIAPLNIDANKNGWDDAYDLEMGGTCYTPVDTDGDGIPDMLDTDSDADGRSDLVEAFNLNTDGKAGIQLLFSDYDNDGLDDAFDQMIKGYNWQNSTASNCSPTDSNHNGIRDWRDITSHFSSQSAYIFPNPASESFQFFQPNLKYNQQLCIQIQNLNGQLKKVYKTTYSNERIPVQDLINGYYIVTVTSNGLMHSQQILIQH